MIDLEESLNRVISKQYELMLTERGLLQSIKEDSERILRDRYIRIEIQRNNYIFKLKDIKCEATNYNYHLDSIEINLHYFNISKLSEELKKGMETVLRCYRNNGKMFDVDAKKGSCVFYIQDRYLVEYKDLKSEKFNLKIEGVLK